MKNSVQKTVNAAMLAAIVCVATMVIKVPSPLKGYLNLGDCAVLLSAWLLPPSYGFLAAGIGSALADIFSGYIIYAPATFIIKGVMAITANTVSALLSKKGKFLFPHILSAISAEIIMVLGYYLFEGFLYGFSPSLINIPANAVQGASGTVIGVMLITALKKAKLGKNI